MPYHLQISPAANRNLRRLPPSVRDRLEPVVLSLETDPRPFGVLKVEGEERAYRVRVGDYRIVYEMHDHEHLVLILRVVRRNEGTYRGL